MRKALPIGAMVLVLSAGTASAQTRLELRHPEGTSRFKYAVSIQQTLTILGMETKTAVENNSVSSRSVGKPGGDGAVRVQETTEALRINLQLPGGISVEYDSDKPSVKQDNQMLQDLVDALALLKGASYTIVVKDGKAVAIEGADKILATAKPEQAALLAEQLSPEKLLRDENQNLARIPREPVKMGERWKREEIHAFGGGQLMTFQTYYEYQGPVEKDGKTLDKIGVFVESVKYSLGPNATIPLQLANSDLKVDSSSGTLLLDRASGQVVEDLMSVHIVGGITFTLNGMDLPSTLDLKMTMGSRRQ